MRQSTTAAIGNDSTLSSRWNAYVWISSFSVRFLMVAEFFVIRFCDTNKSKSLEMRISCIMFVLR